VITYKGGRFPFEDKQFSIVYSNAVIEHVGEKQEQLLFIKEMRRVGYQIYFSTPAKEFPLELHTNYPFIHWFPKEKFNKVATYLGKEWAAGAYMNLLRKEDITILLEAANVRQYKILTHRLGPFPLHYAVWVR
jgi:SAM-dependent methyltransferase